MILQMKKTVSKIAALAAAVVVMLFLSLAVLSTVHASSDVEVDISLISNPGTENAAYIERVLIPDSVLGAEITITNTGTQSASVRPFAVLYPWRNGKHIHIECGGQKHKYYSNCNGQQSFHRLGYI